MGWLLQVIMHLGRWASAAGMAYVEEALSELAPGAPRKLEESIASGSVSLGIIGSLFSAFRVLRS